ncbi:carbohydrate kinase family protein [Hungatella hathewayi]|uniref:Carbohydrate kinase family protein n=1 Tax=Hungatella hathewayi TaxID=154046 RepID=A0A3E2WYR8_9FIRM|nr:MULTISPECIES: carbohydrate kinase family protein [Clostridia]MRM86957.1 carbohydrate kinase family protein [Faecalicatena contorta]RGC33619.1 carbohydrate kinase family protein [Hungatella hathewayi]GKH32161.1 ribokinase [Faecalicatena contorta]
MDVVGVGYPVQDMLVRIEQIPKARVHVLSKILSSSWQGGGMVSTGLVAASVLGASAGMIGVVGGDLYGKACINDFRMNGVDTSHLLIDEGETTNYTIVLTETSTKERCFVANDGSKRELAVEELDEAYIRQAKYLLITEMDEVSIRAAEIAKANGVKVVIDADLYEKRTMDHIHLIDVFICSEEFYRGLFQDEKYVIHCREIQAMGPEAAVVTLGDKGCRGVYGDTVIDQKAFTDIEVVDTNGAGDVFHGAFIYGMAQGWEPEYIARFASAVSAIKCTRQGGRAGIPDAETTKKFLETGRIDYTEIDKRVEIYKNGLF